jgi:hypothetical protein
MIYQSSLPVPIPGRSNNKTIIISLVGFLLLFVLVSHASAEEKILQLSNDSAITVKVPIPLILGIFVLLLYYLVVWNKVGRDPEKGIIMPIYTPPEGLSPERLRYILKMGYTDKVFSAALINLAVKGYLEIKETSVDHLFKKSFKYTLYKNQAKIRRRSSQRKKKDCMYLFLMAI